MKPGAGRHFAGPLFCARAALLTPALRTLGYVESSQLDAVCEALTEAVLAGAAEVIRVRRSGDIGAYSKDATELVTAADQASDAAIRKVFESRFPAIDPAISFVLEESGGSALPGAKEAGADPLDGTNHFASGGCSYSVQAYYAEQGIPLVGVVFQPEVFLPLEEEQNCVGRLTWAIRGAGAFTRRTRMTESGFELSPRREVKRRALGPQKRFVSCVPISARMKPEERERVRGIVESGLVSVTTGVGNAGGNVMLIVFGGQHVYANFGSGHDLDLVPPQVIADEAGLTVWGVNRKPPVWSSRKQPMLVAPNPEVAELFLRAAGY